MSLLTSVSVISHLGFHVLSEETCGVVALGEHKFQFVSLVVYLVIEVLQGTDDLPSASFGGASGESGDDEVLMG